jgi:hypothetical protein
MFSFRRKNAKRDQDDDAQIHTSPSLPELTAQGLSWPESLVDVASIQQEPAEPPLHQGAAKTSISTIHSAPIPFHKPFRGSPGKATNGGPISSLYMSSQQPPSVFDNWRTTTHPPPTNRKSQRRTRIPPTFNLMVRSIPSSSTAVAYDIGSL